jgi:hypothetical protein
MLSVVDSFVTKKDDEYDSKAMECRQDSEILTPIYLLNEETGNERSQVRSDKETECPEVDFSSSLVEKEHVMDDRETDHLWCSVEEALESSTCCESSVGWCLRCADDNDTGENLRPE